MDKKQNGLPQDEQEYKNEAFDNIEFTHEFEINNLDQLDIKVEKFTTQDDTNEFATIEVDIKKLHEEIDNLSHEREDVSLDTIDFSENPGIFLTESEEELIYQKQILERKNKQLKIISICLIILLIFIGITAGIINSKDARFVQSNTNNTIELSSINVYGESINLGIAEEIDSLQLYNRETEEYLTVEVGYGIDQQLKLADVDYGNYYLFINDKLSIMTENPKISFQTINRNSISKKVSITTSDSNVLSINITQPSSQQVDIIIDPSQGGVQGYVGADGVTTEQELSLKYALELATQLEDLGYNVQLTRYIDQVPGECDIDDLYCSDGRIAQAYSSNAKLYIALGFNGGSNSGFEIIDSHQSSHQLARSIKEQIDTTLTPLINYEYQIEPGIINKTYLDSSGIDIDYSNYIRETGGSIMNSDNQQAIKYTSNPVGTEAIQLKLGYISNEDDFTILSDEDEMLTIVKEIAMGVDNYINQ